MEQVDRGNCGARCRGRTALEGGWLVPRVCTICSHEGRAAIEEAMVTGTAKRRIASQYGVTERAVRYHMREHLPALLAKAREAEQAARADDLLRDVKDIRSHTIALLMRAEQEDDRPTILRAIREARENVRLLGELHGKLDLGPRVELHMHPEWIELRTVIVGAVTPFPEARMAVLRAVRGHDGHD